MIRALTRIRAKNLGEPIPQFAVENNAQYWATIEKNFKAIAKDVQGLNTYRYPQLTGGNQEFMEALSFQHYLENQTLVTYEESKAKVASLCGDEPIVPLTVEDYVLGIFDMIGELMRFSITSMATNGKLPAGRRRKNPKAKQEGSEAQVEDKMDIDEQAPATSQDQEPRTVLQDLREIRLQLEMFEPPPKCKFHDETEKKATVMRQCVDKVEKALYSLMVRGKERPKGWKPDVPEDRRQEVESF